MISAVILTAATIAMSLAALTWSQYRSSQYQEEYSQLMGIEIARLKERLALEFTFYNSTQNNVRIFLLNYGTIGDVKIQAARLSNDTWYKTFSNPSLVFLNGTAISDDDLDIKEEGYLTLAIESASLKTATYYYITVTTQRGATFYWGFVA